MFWALSSSLGLAGLQVVGGASPLEQQAILSENDDDARQLVDLMIKSAWGTSCAHITSTEADG